MLKLEFATPSHAEGILQIYAPFVKDTHVSFEHTVPSTGEISERISRISSFYPWIVLLDDGKVAAYGYASRLRGRKGYDWSAELSVYVHPEYYRKSLGGLIYDAMIDILILQRVHQVCGVVCLPNEGSCLFHERKGFTKTGVFPDVGFKFGKWWTTAWYFKTIIPGPATHPFRSVGELTDEELSVVRNYYNELLSGL